MRYLNSSSAIAVLAFALLLALPSKAQEPKGLTPAPVPVQITTAKKIFISNGGSETFPESGKAYSGGTSRAYDQFYAAIKKWGKYEIVSTPSSADLIFEIRLSAPIIPTLGSPRADFQLRVVIRDTRTQTMLWASSTHIDAANRLTSRDQNFNVAMDYLVSDIERLSGELPPPHPGSAE